MVLAHAADIVGFAVVGIGLVVMKARSLLKARRDAKADASGAETQP